jgi:hypothetical protein
MDRKVPDRAVGDTAGLVQCLLRCPRRRLDAAWDTHPGVQKLTKGVLADRRHGHGKLDELLQESPSEIDIAGQRGALVDLRDDVRIAQFDLSGEHGRFDPKDEHAVTQVAGEEEVYRLQRLHGDARRAAVEVVHEHDQWPIRRRDQVEDLLEVVLDQVHVPGSCAVPRVLRHGPQLTK